MYFKGWIKEFLSLSLNLSLYLIKTSQSEEFLFTQYILGNFKYGSEHSQIFHFFVSADSILKEYEIIVLIYYRKTCRLDLYFCVPEDIIL